MAKIIDISEFRHKKRKNYMSKIETRLDEFLCQFIESHLKVDFIAITERYQADMLAQSEMAWDYQDLRDSVGEAIDMTYGEEIYLQLRQQYWFDAKLISKDAVLERVLSTFVLGSELAATSDF